MLRGRGTREIKILAVVVGSMMALLSSVNDMEVQVEVEHKRPKRLTLGHLNDPRVQAYADEVWKKIGNNPAPLAPKQDNKKEAAKPAAAAPPKKPKEVWGETKYKSNQTIVLLKPWDPKTEPKVNPHPFKFVLNNAKMCEDKDVFLLIYIHTSTDHYSRRALIRSTYGNYEAYEEFEGMKKVRLIFVMGMPSEANAAQETALKEESSLHNDIVQESFMDTYHNLSYKAIGAMRWIKEYCSHAKYVLKVDDDVFVNIFPLIKHFQDLDKAGHNKGLILCLVWWKMHVLREGKWGIPREIMPDDLYPPYCSGMAYMFSTDVAIRIYDVSFYVPFFWVDDAYISGMLPKKANMSHTDFSIVYKGRKEIEPLMTSEEWYKYCFSHIHDLQLFKRMWKHILQKAKNFRIPAVKEIKPGKLADKYRPVVEVLKDYEKKTGQKLDIPYLRKLDKPKEKEKDKNPKKKT